MWLSSPATRRGLQPLPRRRRTSPGDEIPRPASPTSTLAEVLRRNPFRAGSKDALVPGNHEQEDPCLSLNRDLRVLAEFFPDVQVEVLRELLQKFDGDSRLPICTEQLYRYKHEWAKGRLQNPPRGVGEGPFEEHELFRTQEYLDAVGRTVAREFGSLNKSAIDAVLAEVNSSYTHARPILQHLANKSWRTTFANIFRKKRSRDEAPESLLDKSSARPRLLATGSAELDAELAGLFVLRVSRKHRDQFSSDLEYAHALNHKEAEDAGALYECQICYNDVTFEEIAACTAASHAFCLECVRRTLNEALFGQGWARSLDAEHATLKCHANDDCPGHIPQDLLKRCVLAEKAGEETWARFEARLTEDALLKSGLPIVRCPFCNYAEADNVHTARSARSLRWHFRRPPHVHLLTFILLLELVPLLCLLLLPVLLLFPHAATDAFYRALAARHSSARNPLFRCRNPSCLRRSCLSCSKAWHDPHACHSTLLQSLRTTVEAARTAAVKRTCPRCGTSFVKGSGCNKLVCVCGYAMCYVCRANIGKGAPSNPALVGARAAPETGGYRHFCEHFRPSGGKCTECDKCDLYRGEDEDEAVRRAGQEAERAWREREGMVGVTGLESAAAQLDGARSGFWGRVRRGEWSVQGTVDWVVGEVVVVDPH